MFDALCFYISILPYIYRRKMRGKRGCFLHIQNGLNGKILQKGSGLAKTLHVYTHN